MLKDFPSVLELKKLIMHTSVTVWKQEITEKEIDKWLDNFHGEILNQDEEKILAAGCDAYMSKPFDIHELNDKVAELLRIEVQR